jgi:hypothetical protein
MESEESSLLAKVERGILSHECSVIIVGFLYSLQ